MEHIHRTIADLEDLKSQLTAAISLLGLIAPAPDDLAAHVNELRNSTADATDATDAARAAVSARAATGTGSDAVGTVGSGQSDTAGSTVAGQATGTTIAIGAGERGAADAAGTTLAAIATDTSGNA